MQRDMPMPLQKTDTSNLEMDSGRMPVAAGKQGGISYRYATGGGLETLVETSYDGLGMLRQTSRTMMTTLSTKVGNDIILCIYQLVHLLVKVQLSVTGTTEGLSRTIATHSFNILSPNNCSSVSTPSAMVF
jgi:hypothetical protein